MPIPRCVSTNKYTCMLFTGGPFSEETFTSLQAECKQAIYNIIYKGYGVKLAACLVAMEKSNGGYRHFHAAVLLTKQERFTTVSKKLKEYIQSLPHEDETQKPNCGVYHWPRSEADPWKCAKAYLTAPVKDKSIDAQFLEVDPVDWIAFWRKNRYMYMDPLDEAMHDEASPVYGWTLAQLSASCKATKKLCPGDLGHYMGYCPSITVIAREMPVGAFKGWYQRQHPGQSLPPWYRPQLSKFFKPSDLNLRPDGTKDQ